MNIGIGALPAAITSSGIFTAEQINLLASVTKIPTVDPSFYDDRLKNIFQYYSLTPDEMEIELHVYAAHLLDQQKINEAWQVLISMM